MHAVAAVTTHAPVAPTGRLDRLPALLISNLAFGVHAPSTFCAQDPVYVRPATLLGSSTISNPAYIRFSSIKVKTLGRCAVGYDVCTQQPPPLGVHAQSTFCAQDAVYVRQLCYIQPFCIYDFLIVKTNSYETQHCVRSKGNPRSHFHSDPYTVSQETNLLT